MTEIYRLWGGFSYSAAAIGFLFIALLALFRTRGHFPGKLLVAASCCSALWAAAFAWLFWSRFPPPGLEILEALNRLAWLLFLWSLAIDHQGDAQSGKTYRRGAFLLLILGLVAALLGLDPALAGGWTQPLRLALNTGEAAFGIVLIFSLLRDIEPDNWWRLKFLLIGLGAFLAYDLVMYAYALMLLGVDPVLLAVRGSAALLVTPLIAVSVARSADWPGRLSLSRGVVVSSAALIAVGAYLAAMAAALYALALLGLPIQRGLGLIVPFGGLVLLAVFLLSGRVRSQFRRIVAKNFFRLKYDYRREWTAFLDTIANDAADSLEGRIIRALASIMDSPSGALWARRGSRFEPIESWNVTVPPTGLDQALPLIRLWQTKSWIVEIGKPAPRSAGEPRFEVPGDIATLPRGWLLVPLSHLERLEGFVLLGQPRSPHSLDWEDFDILRMAGRQAASYLAEQRAVRSLTEVQEFERFAKNTAFVIHDVKNLISQLSVAVSNFDRFRDRPEFLDDIVATMRESVERMRRLIDRLAKARADTQAKGFEGAAQIRLGDLLEKVMHRRNSERPRIFARLEDPDILVHAHEDRLEGVIEHLLQNALDASGSAGSVHVEVSVERPFASIRFVDQGEGMDSEFVRRKLFRPFRSSKAGGLGLGMVQCRDYAEELGGDLNVESQLGRGTIVRLRIPVAMGVAA